MADASVDAHDPPTTAVDVSPARLDVPVAERYRQSRVIGAGGMGEIALCHDQRTGRDVALKRMRLDGDVSASARERFEREARVQAQLEHPGIVPVYDLGVGPDGDAYFTMKRVHGLTLDEVLAGLRGDDPDVCGTFTLRRLLRALSTVCLTLDFAHSRGVIHRDVKPSNIMLGEFGEVSLLDWGLAKVAGEKEPEISDLAAALGKVTPGIINVDGASPTVVGTVLGTPGYMAPEQVHGEVDGLTAAADVFALGAILFEILAGRALIERAPTHVMMMKVLSPVDARVSVHAPEVDEALEAICMRATSLSPPDRYRSARDMSDAIDAYLNTDLDREHRRRVAEAHAKAAEQALAVARREGSSYEEAGRELRSALALDPGHRRALALLLRLLVELPTQLPAEAERALREHRQHEQPTVARMVIASHLVSGTLAATLPLWVGVRSWPPYLAILLAHLVIIVACYREKELRLNLPITVSMGVIIACATGFAGPLLLAPSMATVYVMMSLVALRNDPRAAYVVTSVVVLAIAAPLLLSTLGWLPSFYQFDGEVIRILPTMVNLPPGPTTLALVVLVVTVLAIPVLAIGRWVDALAHAEREAHLRAWQLRQFVPEVAQELGDDER